MKKNGSGCSGFEPVFRHIGESHLLIEKQSFGILKSPK
jgi:hypothetical protein